MVYEKVRGHRVWWLKKNGKSIGEFDINGITSDEESEKNVDDIVKLDSDNASLREELDALKQSIPKLNADAIRNALHQWEYCSDKNIRANLEHHASQIEAGS
jgi:hypothetical protein